MQWVELRRLAMSSGILLRPYNSISATSMPTSLRPSSQSPLLTYLSSYALICHLRYEHTYQPTPVPLLTYIGLRARYVMSGTEMASMLVPGVPWISQTMAGLRLSGGA